MRPLTPLAADDGPQEQPAITRQTMGGCYDVRGTQISPVRDDSASLPSLDCWRRRQADLWGESWAIIHLDRHLTDEEHGLFFAMRRELLIVDNAVLRLEAGSPSS